MATQDSSHARIANGFRSLGLSRDQEMELTSRYDAAYLEEFLQGMAELPSSERHGVALRVPQSSSYEELSALLANAHARQAREERKGGAFLLALSAAAWSLPIIISELSGQAVPQAQETAAGIVGLGGYVEGVYALALRGPLHRAFGEYWARKN